MGRLQVCKIFFWREFVCCLMGSGLVLGCTTVYSTDGQPSRPITCIVLVKEQPQESRQFASRGFCHGVFVTREKSRRDLKGRFSHLLRAMSHLDLTHTPPAPRCLEALQDVVFLWRAYRGQSVGSACSKGHRANKFLMTKINSQQTNKAAI